MLESEREGEREFQVDEEQGKAKKRGSQVMGGLGMLNQICAGGGKKGEKNWK